jgi:hypothetical protein
LIQQLDSVRVVIHNDIVRQGTMYALPLLTAGRLSAEYGWTEVQHDAGKPKGNDR